MTKALTITPKISSGYTTKARKTINTLQNNFLPLPKKNTSKATRGLVGGVIDIFKAIINKISKPEDAVSKISKGISAPSHKDPAAIVMKTIHG